MDYYGLRSRQKEPIDKPSPPSSNDDRDDGNISDFSDYPFSGTNPPDLSCRSKYQPTPTIRSFVGSFRRKKLRNHNENDKRSIIFSETREEEGSEIHRQGLVSPLTDSPTLSSSVRTLHWSPNVIGSSVKVSASESPSRSRLQSVSDKASSSDDDDDGEVIEIRKATEVMLHRVHQGSSDICIKEMPRLSPAHSSISLPPRSDSYNTIPDLSKTRAAQVLDQEIKFKTGIERALPHVPAVTDCAGVQPEADRVGNGQVPSGSGTGIWPMDRMGSLRKRVPNSPDLLSSQSMHQMSLWPSAAETQGTVYNYSPAGHPSEFDGHNQTLGRSRPRADKMLVQENKAPTGAIASAHVQSVSSQSGGGRRGNRRQTLSADMRIRTPDDLDSRRNPVLNRVNGLRSHPVATAQRAALPVWIKLTQPLPPLPRSDSGPCKKNSQP